VVEYHNAWNWQIQTAEAVRGGAYESLALLQHPPVFTFGRRVRPEHLLIPAEDLIARGATLVESDRGGDITFHGPGQVVGYPILDLKRRGLGPNEYVRRLEEMLIRTCAGLGVEAGRIAGRPGVWAGNAKVAAIGVRLQSGVTTHGFALNVETDLSWFAAIVPCGLADAGVTSLSQLLGESPGIEAVQDSLASAFETVFDVNLVLEPVTVPSATREAVLAHGH
jgi:lipoate-protein ligase B